MCGPWPSNHPTSSRLEGKKTMGHELAEQMGAPLPDAIIYPIGGGTGRVRMWKALEETVRRRGTTLHLRWRRTFHFMPQPLRHQTPRP